MELPDFFQTIKQTSDGLYKEKGSKFLSFAFPINDVAEVKTRREELRKQYYDSRHYCYAYILGKTGDTFRANDDGEPGHSAGDPILGQIKSRELTNTLVVVVRYFGGTKLGVSGLINAYKTAASEALDSNSIIKIPILKSIKIRFEYPLLNAVMKLIKDEELKMESQEMGMSCEMTLGVIQSRESFVREKLADLHQVTIVKN